MESIRRLTLTSMIVLLILSSQLNSGIFRMPASVSRGDATLLASTVKSTVTETTTLKKTASQLPSVIGKQRYAVVLLVSFADQKISTRSTEWHKLVFSKEDGGSVRQYYEAMSDGKLVIAPVAETQGTLNDGVIEVVLKVNHPNNGSVLMKENYTAVWLALNEAVTHMELKALDVDGNKWLSSKELLVIAVFAGYEDLFKAENGKSSSGFSHRLLDQNKVDGIRMTDFVQIGELYFDKYLSKADTITTYGILAHEIGHVLGLPDLYDTDYSSYGVGLYSLMGNGDKLFKSRGRMGDTPASLDPWSRVFLGFAEAEVVEKSGIYTLHSADVTSSPTYLKIKTGNSSEYFLIENRYTTKQDQGLAYFSTKGGILIWHIDEAIIKNKFDLNTVNNDELKKGVDLVEASEAILGYSQLDTMSGDQKYAPFFTAKNVDRMGYVTIPSLTLHDGKRPGFELVVIEDGYTAKVSIIFSK